MSREIKQIKENLEKIGFSQFHEDGDENIFGYFKDMTIRICIDNPVMLIVERVYPNQGIVGMASLKSFNSQEKLENMRDMTYQEALKNGLYEDFHEID